ncbi:exonuclease domain-containing protein [Streptomyces violaceusniger]|uniref:exonuclease domain-containing protein n=1 Tax=Streptomyces violaceusniger TaxID=68280 RepID=UPI0001E4E4E6|nr:exonuclease domain-containing protein [Streptomyces violaceusniger]
MTPLGRHLGRNHPRWRGADPETAERRVLDTLRLAKATYQDLPRYSLDALIKHTAPDLAAAPAQRHRATYDAYATAQLLITTGGHYDTYHHAA